MAINYELGVAILGSISIIVTIIFVIISFLIDQLRKHPGKLVFYQCILQIIYDLHFVLVDSFYMKIPSSLCQYFGFVFTFCYFLAWNYNTCLALEIYFKLKETTNTSYKKRNKMYHIISWTVALALNSIIAVVKNFGPTSYGTCFVAKQTYGHFVEIFPVVINFPLLVTFSIFSIKEVTKTYESFVVSVAVSNMVLSLTLTISNIFSFIIIFDEDSVTSSDLHIGAMIGACSGLTLSCSRLFSKSLYKKIRKLVRKKRNHINISLQEYMQEGFFQDESSADIFRSTIWNLNEFFENLTKKTIAEILITLYLRYANEAEVMHIKKLMISYSKEKYDSLLEYFPYINHLYNPSCLIIEYNPDIFAEIRNNTGFDSTSLSQTLIQLENFTNIKAEGTNKGGKSGSFFFTTSDGNIIMKTIRREERKNFINNMLKYYGYHVLHHDSRLVRVLGVFKVFPSNLDFVIMENIIPKVEKIVVYDIKGYISENRTGEKMVKKDTDFIESSFNMNTQVKNELIKVLEEDMILLRYMSVMDYSVLIGHCQDVMKITSRYLVNGHDGFLLVGIIDIFQEYNFRKNCEHKVRRFFTRKDISCIDPDAYYRRLFDFLVKHL
ncbi:hypothetical protein SteCoe_28151 [Stentor coeruleus]|uniref:PIPK domain-containing protein n=1 Tax=Stentor coeruleus TaxID=5963 RepID=A0A1R2B8V8_9CILI|nr:hypothetical protein SteCoe_28151 [Stentor coeruleus]